MSDTALAEGPKKELRHTASSPVTPMQMLQTAVEQGADIDKLEKLMQLQERWESNEARKAWNQAMNALKANPPHVTKNRQVGYGSKGGRTEYRHASLDHMADAVSEAMSPHGLSFRWETKQENGEITVTCIVSHKDGHSERTTLSAGADNSGGKNSIQAVGSAVTYLQRYTLKAAIGIAEEDQDDDAQAVSRQPLESDPKRLELVKHLSAAAETSNDAFLAEWKKLGREDRNLVGRDEYNGLKRRAEANNETAG